MVQKKYKRINNIAAKDDETQGPPIGHPHDSSPTSQGLCGESSRTTERAPPPPPPPRYKKGDVIIIGMNSICSFIFITDYFTYILHIITI